MNFQFVSRKRETFWKENQMVVNLIWNPETKVPDPKISKVKPIPMRLDEIQMTFS